MIHTDDAKEFVARNLNKRQKYVIKLPMTLDDRKQCWCVYLKEEPSWIWKLLGAIERYTPIHRTFTKESKNRCIELFQEMFFEEEINP